MSSKLSFSRLKLPPTWLRPAGCGLAERFLRARSVGALGNLRARWLERHLGGCEPCRELEVSFAHVDAELQRLAADEVVPRGELRARVVFAFHHGLGDSLQPEAVSRGRLEWSLWTAGAVAAATLVVTLLVSRWGDFTPVPRTVRIELPAESELVGEPQLIIRRISGREEVR